MLELLSLCGFDQAESAALLPRVQQVFTRVGLTAEDVRVAKSRITTYYDLELRGVRKLLGLFLKDFCKSRVRRTLTLRSWSLAVFHPS